MHLCFGCRSVRLQRTLLAWRSDYPLTLTSMRLFFFFFFPQQGDEPSTRSSILISRPLYSGSAGELALALRWGWPTLGLDGAALLFPHPSSIIIHLSASPCLLASSQFISISPPSSCQRDLLEPCQTSVMFSSQPALPSISA